MNRVKKYFWIVFLISGMQLYLSCERPEEMPYDDPNTLNLSEYTFIPEQPTSREETQLVFRGCSYYQTVSVRSLNKGIEVKKRFNSQLKWPCVVKLDTIPLGKLTKGEYQVSLQIIDVNPFVSDSVFFSETKILSVTNK